MHLPPTILVATTNAHKAQEIAEILHLEGTELVDLAQVLGTAFEPCDETGSTFEENARLKALHYARLSGLPTLADDSGLVVDALGGAPGVHSARWEGETTPYSIKNARLVERLAGVPEEQRSARFVCVAAFAEAGGACFTVEGIHEGRIALEPAGVAGFGYDPVFFSSSEGLTFAELPAERKNAVSHRGRALHGMSERLRSQPTHQVYSIPRDHA